MQLVLYRTALCGVISPSHAQCYRRLRAADGTGLHFDTIAQAVVTTFATCYLHAHTYIYVDFVTMPALVARSTLALIPTPSAANLIFEAPKFPLRFAALLLCVQLNRDRLHEVDVSNIAYLIFSCKQAAPTEGGLCAGLCRLPRSCMHRILHCNVA